ncbi:MAG: hypothetical protein ACUVXI_01840 [bacterium]
MEDSLFWERMRNFRGEGELCAFNLALVAEALDTVGDLEASNMGTEVVERRIGEYKSWDPEILKVDKDTENRYRRRLEERGGPFVLLSEELGRLEINRDAPGELLYVVSDPFDGSYLFRRGIPDFWYSSLAFYGADLKPRSCAVGDCVHRVLAFAHDGGAFIAKLAGSALADRFKLDGDYRRAMGRGQVVDLKEASIESYALKPGKFLLPLVEKYRDLLGQFKFFLPNGGPYGFVDVAEGKIDVYFAWNQPFVDVFSGISIAQSAGIVVTDFEGREVAFEDNVTGLYNVVASTNPKIHESVLNLIEKCGR